MQSLCDGTSGHKSTNMNRGSEHIKLYLYKKKNEEVSSTLDIYQAEQEELKLKEQITVHTLIPQNFTYSCIS